MNKVRLFIEVLETRLTDNREFAKININMPDIERECLIKENYLIKQLLDVLKLREQVTKIK